MGMFDSVYVRCPKCGQNVEFQSKGGECILAAYTDLNNIPVDVASDLNTAESCDCGNTVSIVVPSTVSIRLVD